MKTFPLRHSEEYHDKLKDAAEKSGLSLNKFLYAAIDEKIARVERKEESKRKKVSEE